MTGLHIKSKTKVLVKHNPKTNGQYRFISTNEEFLRKAKDIQDELSKIDQSKLNDEQRNAYALAQSLIQEADQSSFMGENAEADSALDMAKSFVDFALGVTPVVSIIKDVYELVTGTNMVTGEPLSDFELVAAAIGPLTGGLSKIFGKSAKIKKLLKSVQGKFGRKKGVKAGGKAVDDVIDEAASFQKRMVDNYNLNPDSKQIKWIANMKEPNKRHLMNKLKPDKRYVKDKNTVISNHVDVQKDMSLIREGKAVRIRDNVYEVNGRQYGLKDGGVDGDHGSLYPISGDGLYTLSRGEYKALSTYVSTNGSEGVLFDGIKYGRFTFEDMIEAQKIWLNER